MRPGRGNAAADIIATLRPSWFISRKAVIGAVDADIRPHSTMSETLVRHDSAMFD
jgi:hypothetical protein